MEIYLLLITGGAVVIDWLKNYPFKYQTQTALFKDPVHTAQ